jgi:hypothetical protein
MMACRCAVVDIRSERVRGLIEDGVTGRLAEPTPEALADAVLQLLWDKPLRQQIVERAYARVKDSNWQRSARQVEAVLLRHAPPPDQRQQQRRRTVDGVDALVWQIQQLLDAESDNSAQIDQLRALLNQTLVEKAQLYRQLQQAEDAYNRLYVQQQAAPLQKLKQVAVQTAYEQTPVWHLGNAALSKVLLTPEPLWQTFTADDAPLCRIELLFARHSAYHGGAIRFVLYETTPEPRLISEQLLPSAAIQPDSPFAIDFPPQTAAIGRSYRFGLMPVDGAGETHYALWRFWSPQHRNAQLQQNEQPVHGQLAFQLFYGQPPACQPGTSGPAAWGQTIRFRATTLQAATVAKASEGVRLTQKAQQLVRQHGIAGLVGESVRYIQWRLMQWQKLGK